MANTKSRVNLTDDAIMTMSEKDMMDFMLNYAGSHMHNFNKTIFSGDTMCVVACTICHQERIIGGYCDDPKYEDQFLEERHSIERQVNGTVYIMKAGPQYLSDNEWQTIMTWIRNFRTRPDKLRTILTDPCFFMAKPAVACEAKIR